jgi:anti-sigma regulatory factor (Ser/Thr protein kinase)/CheY-like chemotaxis protein
VGNAVTPRSVVVADDDADYRLLVRLGLAAGADLELVGEAAGLAEAVSRTQQLRPDLLLLDAGLAGPEAVAVVGEVARLAPATVVVLASARPGGEPLGPHGRELAVISKAVPPADLARELLGCLGGPFGPEAPAPTCSASFAPDLANVRRARQWVRGVLEDWGEDALVEPAMLLTSEVVTNALVHGRSGVEVCVGRHGDGVRIAVTDSDTGFIRRRPAPAHSQSGRGVELVESMSSSWGIVRFSDGKQVWFELSRSAP